MANLEVPALRGITVNPFGPSHDICLGKCALLGAAS